MCSTKTGANSPSLSLEQLTPRKLNSDLHVIEMSFPLRKRRKIKSDGQKIIREEKQQLHGHLQEKIKEYEQDQVKSQDNSQNDGTYSFQCPEKIQEHGQDQMQVQDKRQDSYQNHEQIEIEVKDHKIEQQQELFQEKALVQSNDKFAQSDSLIDGEKKENDKIQVEVINILNGLSFTQALGVDKKTVTCENSSGTTPVYAPSTTLNTIGDSGEKDDYSDLLDPLDHPRATKAKEIRLEQNRKAARESRRRRKVMIEELQRSVVFFSRANGPLSQQNNELERMLLEAQSKVTEIERIRLLSRTAALEMSRKLNEKDTDAQSPSDERTTTNDVPMGENKYGQHSGSSSTTVNKKSNEAESQEAHLAEQVKLAQRAVSCAQAQAQAQAQHYATLAQQAQAHAMQLAATQALYEAQCFPTGANQSVAQPFNPAVPVSTLQNKAPQKKLTNGTLDNSSNIVSDVSTSERDISKENVDQQANTLIAPTSSAFLNSWPYMMALQTTPAIPVAPEKSATTINSPAYTVAGGIQQNCHQSINPFAMQQPQLFPQFTLPGQGGMPLPTGQPQAISPMAQFTPTMVTSQMQANFLQQMTQFNAAANAAASEPKFQEIPTLSANSTTNEPTDKAKI